MSDTRSPPAAFNSAREFRESRFLDYPIPQEPTHYTWRRRYHINSDNYSRTALDTADAIKTTAYLVDEPLLERFDKVQFFERLFATIPAAWTEYASYAYRYPAVTGAVTFGSLVNSGITAALNGSNQLVVTKNSHGLSNGQRVQLYFTNSYGYASLWSTITSSTSNTFTFAYLVYPAGTNFSSLTYQTIDSTPGHGIIDRTPTARIVHDYALPGVTSGITTAADFQALPVFQVLDSTGNVLEELSGSSIPTASAYLAAIDANQYLVAASSVGRYLGNILERVTTYVPYV